MKPVVQIELTGANFLAALGLVLAALGVLGLVWLLTGPAYAIAGGIGLVVLVRSVLALLGTR